MEKVRFVCLANSFKEGGRCVAGIVLDNNNNPVDNKNQWIRPVCNTAHNEIPTYLVNNINILDILEIEISSYPNLDNYQSENALFVETTLRIIGKYNGTLDDLCDSNRLIFGNRGKAIIEEEIAKHNRSLVFVKPTNFEFFQKTYDDNPNPQTRLRFTYCENQYDLPITDPIFLKKYQSNPNFPNDFSQIYLTISIGVVHNGWHNKLVAGIILS
jgi:hypothetical protein